MHSKYDRSNGKQISRAKIVENVRKSNFRLLHSRDKREAARAADRLVDAILNLKLWMYRENVTIKTLAEGLGLNMNTVQKWLQGFSRPRPICRLNLERYTKETIKAVDWSTQFEIEEARKYVEFYKSSIQKKRDAGVSKKRRLAYRDGDKMRLYNCCILCGEPIPYEIRVFIERSPMGVWRDQGPA